MEKIDNTKAKMIAFYLPQFHAIPENDEWWGEGFTEWTNTKKAKPLYEGHYQPHEPAEEIGYYNLLEPDIRDYQAKLAKQHGIYGFCYYHYWFDGKKLLEKPLDEVIKTKKPDFPFCICWANESWNKVWDGKDHEILIKQTYKEGFELAFIKDLIPYLSDERYIRINGKLLILVWRPEQFPNSKRTAEIWRNYVREQGLGEIYLIKVESHIAGIDPESLGFDAAIEFMPNSRELGPIVKESVKHTHIYDYENSIINAAVKEYPNYKLFRGAFASWDNTARKAEKATIFINSSIEGFEFNLTNALKSTYKNFNEEERLVFINAWNEWAEGCHLEPDKKEGRSFLEVCKKLDDKSVADILNSKISFTAEQFEKLVKNKVRAALRPYKRLINMPIGKKYRLKIFWEW